MHAMKQAKLSALKDLIKQMMKLEGKAYEGKETPQEELAEEVEEDEDMEPKSMAEMVSEEPEEEKIPGMKAFMKRSASQPVKGKTKGMMIAIEASPKKIGKRA